MNLNYELSSQIEKDLGINVSFQRGISIPVKNCWHFSSNGNDSGPMFFDDNDFRHGMNRIYKLQKHYKVIPLAFTLMDTHVHFLLYGNFDDCNRFIHEYIRLTSMHNSQKYRTRKSMQNIGISHQVIDNDLYLKTVICYICKNAPAGGLAFNALDYPWSSAPLYFKNKVNWASPSWIEYRENSTLSDLGIRGKRDFLETRYTDNDNALLIDGIIFPGEYIAYEIVEKIFRSTKSFNYFMCRTREDDVDSKGGILSYLTMPIQELRQHKTELCMSMFGEKTVKNLDIQKRIKLARTLKSKYNSSSKQIARVCGLIYEEVSAYI